MTELALVLLALGLITNSIGQLIANRRIKELEDLWTIRLETILDTMKKEGQT